MEKKRQAKFGCAGVTKSKPANTENHAGKTNIIAIGLIQGNGHAGLLKTWLMLVELLFWF
jgi:hypothetical protein